MRFVSIFGIAAVLSIAAQPAISADPLAGYRGVCTWHEYNQIMHQPADVIRQTVHANYADARAALADRSVVGSSRPAFVWAMETNNACGNAIGYMKAGNFNAEAIQKCDCFHTRMQSYR